ncbi:MAG TPA: histidine phosphatase family protein [Gemmatimonadaceae bacterium]|nr:histidine phosphatase family protein [Gemmatimonadaceae bacterium]
MRVTRILLAVAGLAVLPVAMPAQAPSAPTVVIVVRHAEKAAAPAADPPLTDAGVARARALAAAVAAAHVDAVITTQLTRTRETARPAAEARGLPMETVPTGGTTAEHAARVATAVRKHRGHTVLVVGHSNTVTAIIAALGGPALPELCDSQYSTLFTLVLDGPTARLVTSTYGAPSPDVATGCPTMRGGPP